jgi:hypothetical protein
MKKNKYFKKKGIKMIRQIIKENDNCGNCVYCKYIYDRSYICMLYNVQTTINRICDKFFYKKKLVKLENYEKIKEIKKINSCNDCKHLDWWDDLYVCKIKQGNTYGDKRVSRESCCNFFENDKDE